MEHDNCFILNYSLLLRLGLSWNGGGEMVVSQSHEPF